MCACGWREIIVIMVIMPQIIIGKTRRIISKYFRVEKGVDIRNKEVPHDAPVPLGVIYDQKEFRTLIFTFIGFEVGLVMAGVFS